MPVSKRGPCLYKAQRGAGLIEVLIALLVISVGVMGLVVTQMNALTNNRESFYRTQATVLAYDIIDRARANPEQAKSGGYVVALTAAADANNICVSSCTPDNIASSDVALWKTSLASQLPGGNGSVTSITGASDGYVVSVHWTREGEDFSLDFRTRL